MQSAGILPVRPLPPNSESTVERIVDLRVDDHENPFIELRRLLAITTGVPNRLLSRSAELSKAGKHAEAIAEAQKALAINPRSEQAMYQLARRYAAAGYASQAVEQLAVAIARQPKQWKHEAALDPAFEMLRARPDFQRLIAP
jgi:tetratricopeptide (TPR) repeat protein